MGVEEAEGGAGSEDDEDRAGECEAGRDTDDGFGLSMYAGFKRSSETVLFLPLTSKVKNLFDRSTNLLGPSYGC